MAWRCGAWTAADADTITLRRTGAGTVTAEKLFNQSHRNSRVINSSIKPK
jgi:hypothetical protein